MNGLIQRRRLVAGLVMGLAAGSVLAAPKTYKYRCPKCKLIQEYGAQGVKKCPNDGKTMIRMNERDGVPGQVLLVSERDRQPAGGPDSSGNRDPEPRTLRRDVGYMALAGEDAGAVVLPDVRRDHDRERTGEAMIDVYHCPKCSRLLKCEGVLSIGGHELPLFQCEDCIVKKAVFGPGTEEFELAYTFCVDAAGRCFDPVEDLGEGDDD